MKAVRIHEFGGLDVLKWEDSPRPEPRPHQVLIKVDSAGVNYADILRRGGNYPGPDLPTSLGLEAAGTVTEPSAFWWFSRIATIQRVVARVPLSVATMRPITVEPCRSTARASPPSSLLC